MRVEGGCVRVEGGCVMSGGRVCDEWREGVMSGGSHVGSMEYVVVYGE